MIVFAIDYDDTYTEDPPLFDQMIALMRSRGHIAVMVTARVPTNPIAHNPGIEVFYTSAMPKAKYMKDAGLSPSIWIEDMPELVGPRFI